MQPNQQSALQQAMQSYFGDYMGSSDDDQDPRDLAPRFRNAQQQQMMMVHPTVVSASMHALQNGADPQALNIARQQLGDQNYIGYCQAFLEQATQGRQGIWPSATAAWQRQQDKAKPGLDGVKPGDAIYFAPDQSNGGYGHTGIYSDNNKFISATYNGIEENDLGQWQNNTGQQVLGYIPQQTQGQSQGQSQGGQSIQ